MTLYSQGGDGKDKSRVAEIYSVVAGGEPKGPDPEGAWLSGKGLLAMFCR